MPILLFALIPGIDRWAFIAAFEQAFGRAIQSIAVVIVLGSVLAEALKHTGGIERITASMIRWVGERRMPLALTLSGFVVGLAIFSDVGYVILNPLVHSAALNSGLSMSVMATGLVGAMQLTHAMVPPPPGPLAAVALLQADIGRVILFGGVVTLIASLAGWAFSHLVGRVAAVPRVRRPVVHRTRTRGRAALHVVGVCGDRDSACAHRGAERDGAGAARRAHREHGDALPLVAGRGAEHRDPARVSEHHPSAGRGAHGAWIEDGLRVSATIIMVTGLGAALSQILRKMPAVDAIARGMISAGLPAIFLPFLLGVAGNMIAGSTTMGVITAASVAAPMMETLRLSPEATMVTGATGSMLIKHVNSTYFWVCTSLSRMSLKSALISYGGVTFVNGVAAMVVVCVLWAVWLI